MRKYIHTQHTHCSLPQNLLVMDISYMGKEFICPDCKEGFRIQEDIWQSQKERASRHRNQLRKGRRRTACEARRGRTRRRQRSPLGSVFINGIVRIIWTFSYGHHIPHFRPYSAEIRYRILSVSHSLDGMTESSLSRTVLP